MTNTGDWDRAALEKRVDEPDTTTAGTPLPPPNRSLIGYHYDDKPVRWWLFAIVVVILAAFAVAWLATARPAAAHATISAGVELPDTATESGTATWCAPTPRYCQSWGGGAMKGAVASFRYGDTPYRVKVCRVGGACTTVTVVSFCACGSTLIDLSPAAFRQLAPLSRGRIHVTVQTIGRSLRLPPTSTLEDTP